LVVLGGVEGEFAEQLPGVSVDDPQVEVFGEDEDLGAGVRATDADVVQAAVVPQGDDAALVDLVLSGPPVAGIDLR